MPTYIVIGIDDFKKPRVISYRQPVTPFSQRNAVKCNTREEVMGEVGRLLDQANVYWELNPELEKAHQEMFGKPWED